MAELKPLGVGINLQPNAVRELMDLGFTRPDEQIWRACQRMGVGWLEGQDIYAEPW